MPRRPQYANFPGDAAGEAAFFSRLEVDATAPGLLRLEGLFRLDLTGLLPGAPDVQPLLLKEMITRRATSLEANHVVERSTVLAALGVTPEHVLPAPNLIEEPGHVIVTEQTRAIVDDIVGLAGRTLAEFEPLPRKVIFDDGPHVVMQESAKAICLALTSSCPGILSTEELAIVRGINVPTEILTESWEERRARRRNGTERQARRRSWSSE